jgi:F-type H+-transporting ATPase subunit b
MPQFDPTTFSPQLFWLLVTFAVLFVAMWRYALPRISNILEDRQTRIDNDLKKATTVKGEADEVLAEYEKALAEARDRAAAAIKQASDQMAAENAKHHEAFGKELADKTRQAELRIVAAKDEALDGLGAMAAEVAAAATAKLIGSEPPAEQVRKAVEETLRNRG